MSEMNQKRFLSHLLSLFLDGKYSSDAKLRQCLHSLIVVYSVFLDINLLAPELFF